MADRPSTLPTWATGGGAAVGEIYLSDRTTGYAYRQRLAHNRLNAHFNELGQWVEYLDARVTDSDRAAIVAMDAGDQAFTLGDSEAMPGTVFATSTAHNIVTGANVIDLATDGDIVVIVTSTTVRAYRDGVQVWTQTVTAACAAVAGEDVYVGVGQKIQRRARATGALVSETATLGASVVAISVCGGDDIVESVAAAAGNFVHVYTTDLSAGASYDHGATVHGVCILAGRVWAAGDQGSTHLGTSYGVVGLSVGAVLRVRAGASTDYRAVTTDGRRMFAVEGSTVGPVHCFDPAFEGTGVVNATERWESAGAGYATTTGYRITTDGRLVYASASQLVAAIDPATGSTSWICDRDGAVNAVAADWFGLWVAGEAGGDGYRCVRISTGNPARHVVRRDETTRFRVPMAHVATPMW